MTVTYPVAPNGIYWSVQGEGLLLGKPMVFIRLAGCSIGCKLCDTDYRVIRKLDMDAIAREVLRERKHAAWAWITGGEPTDHELAPLSYLLRRMGFRVALATAGHKPITSRLADFLSVSPHDPAKWVQMEGDELKLVPALNGHSLIDFADKAELGQFRARWVVPCDGRPETVTECLNWVKDRQGWRLGTQAHKGWYLP
jgi:7-carboxy-7-deazaguanine synthase